MKMTQLLKPEVPLKWLHLTAGLLWSSVGIFLLSLAFSWLRQPEQQQPLGLALLGVLFAFLFYHFIFSKIATKNLKRLARMAEKSCFFAFQSWKSYLNIVVMISLGRFLRHSQLSTTYLSVAYSAVGGGLFLASFNYYRYLWMSFKSSSS